mmetsp:Transcript_4264/g.15720  ORF Transcript_4264/g.15720 Transcript_4264/m.15720 type:complete len:209 (+) Transcript_4264:2088-2714(+)
MAAAHSGEKPSWRRLRNRHALTRAEPASRSPQNVLISERHTRVTSASRRTSSESSTSRLKSAFLQLEDMVLSRRWARRHSFMAPAGAVSGTLPHKSVISDAHLSAITASARMFAASFTSSSKTSLRHASERRALLCLRHAIQPPSPSKSAASHAERAYSACMSASHRWNSRKLFDTDRPVNSRISWTSSVHASEKSSRPRRIAKLMHR